MFSPHGTVPPKKAKLKKCPVIITYSMTSDIERCTKISIVSPVDYFHRKVRSTSNRTIIRRRPPHPRTAVRVDVRRHSILSFGRFLGMISDEGGHVSDDRPESRGSLVNSEPEHE